VLGLTAAFLWGAVGISNTQDRVDGFDRFAVPGATTMRCPAAQAPTGSRRGAAMTLLVWIAVALMVVGAVMLIAGIGAPGLWIAVIAVGIALVAIDRTQHRHRLGS
jgi:hypothetical protein